MDTQDRTIPVADGRQLHIRETGQLEGLPVVMQSGTPGSILQYHPLIEDAQARGIRLICYARPGFGSSTPQIGRTVADAVKDVAAIVQELDLTQVAVLGHSGGGPHALACAALLPELVVATAVVAPPAPYGEFGADWFNGMGEGNANDFRVAMQGRDALRPVIEQAASAVKEADPATLVESSGAMLSPADKAAFTEDYAQYMLENFREATRLYRDGWIDDDIALTSPWGFDEREIKTPVLLLHGEQDRFVPVAHGKWHARNIPHVDARFSAHDGHISLIVNHVAEVNSWLISKMQ